MAVEYGSARRMTRLASSWLPNYTKKIAPHVVVTYQTRNPHVDASGRLLPAGTFCLALRSPSGELCLLFTKKGLGNGFTAIWGHDNMGLVGIEPNVIDPRHENLANVSQICEEATRAALAWAAESSSGEPSGPLSETLVVQMMAKMEEEIGELERDIARREGASGADGAATEGGEL